MGESIKNPPKNVTTKKLQPPQRLKKEERREEGRKMEEKKEGRRKGEMETERGIKEEVGLTVNIGTIDIEFS